jgi:hypothetical protein
LYGGRRSWRSDVEGPARQGARRAGLYEGVDADGAKRALAALEQLAVLLEVVDDLGPVARRALTAKVKRARTHR